MPGCEGRTTRGGDPPSAPGAPRRGGRVRGVAPGAAPSALPGLFLVGAAARGAVVVRLTSMIGRWSVCFYRRRQVLCNPARPVAPLPAAERQRIIGDADPWPGAGPGRADPHEHSIQRLHQWHRRCVHGHWGALRHDEDSLVRCRLPDSGLRTTHPQDRVDISERCDRDS